MTTKLKGAAKREAKGLPPIKARKPVAPKAAMAMLKSAAAEVSTIAPAPAAPARVSKPLASPLSRKATLVSVAVAQWTARKLDRKLTNEVLRSKGATPDAGRFNKLLIEAKHLEKIGSLVSQARNAHYRYTKPWCDDGMRILPNELHQKFADEFRRIKREFHEAADEFCRDYPSFIEERRTALAKMFNENDYPSARDIRSKFKLDSKLFPVPDVGDFRSDTLDADTIEDIKRDLAETNERVLSDAMKHSAEQIIKVVGHMSEKLHEYKPSKSKKGKKTFFTNSLVENVRELADLLPAFNFTNDPELNRIAARMKRELCQDDAKELRVSERVRVTVQKSADDILKDVNKLLG